MSLARALIVVALVAACASVSVAAHSRVVRHSDHHHHAPATTKPPLAMFDTAASCQQCTGFVDAAYLAVQNTTDMKALLADLQADCAKSSSVLLCDILVAAVVKELPKLPEKLYGSGFYSSTIVCATLGQCSVECCTSNAPTQIHLSAAGAGTLSPTMMTVTWITQDDTADRQVQYGTSPTALTSTATADSHGYTAGGWIGAIHTATMTDLLPSMTYYYRVGGDASGWSSVISFNTIDVFLPANYTFAVYGDLGAERNFSAGNQDWVNFAAVSPQCPEELAINTVIHIGDISYADGYQERWDELFTTLEPAAQSIPYMTIPGNHEVYFNFSSYQNRLAMPTFASGAPVDGMYYSWDAGCVHFVALNSESPLDTVYMSAAQVAWLEADLAAFHARRVAGRQMMADMDEVDAAVCQYSAPTFAVVYMHRPMYCSAGGKEGTKRCGKEAAYLQNLVEAAFQKNEVDLVFAGHVHAYERTTNVFQNSVDPSGPVYILDGAGGNREGQSNNWQSPAPAWSVAHFGVAGLGTLRVINSTTLDWRFYQQTDLAAALANELAPTVSDQVYIHARQ